MSSERSFIFSLFYFRKVDGAVVNCKLSLKEKEGGWDRGDCHFDSAHGGEWKGLWALLPLMGVKGKGTGADVNRSKICLCVEALPALYPCPVCNLEGQTRCVCVCKNDQSVLHVSINLPK